MHNKHVHTYTSLSACFEKSMIPHAYAQGMPVPLLAPCLELLQQLAPTHSSPRGRAHGSKDVESVEETVVLLVDIRNGQSYAMI